jgi:hypothetical protein
VGQLSGVTRRTSRAGAILLGAALAATALAAASSHHGPRHGLNAVGPGCDRACLEGVLNRYLAGLVQHDPAQVPFADHVRFTENNVELRIGDGLWGTVSGIVHPADLEFADPEGGEVGFFGVVAEHGVPGYLALRLKVESGRITEVESIVHRKGEAGPGADAGAFKHDPAFYATEAPAERTPRARLIDLANGYFSTLQLNDGKLFTQFDASCARWENGAQGAGDAHAATAYNRLSCGEQFKLGNYRWDTRVRDRGFLLVDEERGLVLARAFIDHAGVLTDYTLTNGEHRVSPVKSPHTWCMLELFKIRSGRIFRVEAVFIGVPYYTPSPWVHSPR